MFGRLFITLALLAMLSVSCFAIGSILTGTPAFSVAVRKDGLYGDWRAPGQWTMYHQGKYLRALGLLYLDADLTSSAVTEGPNEIAESDVAQQRAEIAEDLLRQSLRASPGQVRGWTSLAWAEALQGNSDATLEALQVSWRLAPFNVGEAPSRLLLVELLADLDETGEVFEKLVETGALNDLKAVALYERSIFKSILETSARYQEVAARSGLI